MTHNENGRSMVEMLGVLAVIGVLAMVGVMGFNHAMRKVQANHLYNDIKLSYASVYTQQNVPYEWTPVTFTKNSKYALSVRQDINHNNFVLITDVEKDICDILTDIVNDGQEMALYHLNNSPITCDHETQSIVASLGGILQKIPCASVDDCPDGFCNPQTHVCDSCQNGQVPNETGDGCIDLTCDEATEILCSNDTDRWCCDNTLLCGKTSNECTSSTGWCAYTFAEPTVTKEYDCAYTFNEPTVSKTYDCAYEITDDVISGVATIGFREIKGCKDGLYCHLKYADTTCGTSAPADIAVGQTIYGSCSPMNASYTACTVSVDQTNVLTPEKECKNGLYCHLKYADMTCGTSASAEVNNAIIYGSCSPMNSSYTSCTVSVDQTNVLEAITPCPSNQYCHLKYKDESCTSADAEISGAVHGVCLPMNSSSAVCPPTVSQ